jgi:hypothetical protein
MREQHLAEQIAALEAEIQQREVPILHVEPSRKFVVRVGVLQHVINELQQDIEGRNRTIEALETERDHFSTACVLCYFFPMPFFTYSHHSMVVD